jgi:hypothetical protein
MHDFQIKTSGAPGMQAGRGRRHPPAPASHRFFPTHFVSLSQSPKKGSDRIEHDVALAGPDSEALAACSTKDANIRNPLPMIFEAPSKGLTRSVNPHGLPPSFEAK